MKPKSHQGSWKTKRHSSFLKSRLREKRRATEEERFLSKEEKIIFVESGHDSQEEKNLAHFPRTVQHLGQPYSCINCGPYTRKREQKSREVSIGFLRREVQYRTVLSRTYFGHSSQDNSTRICRFRTVSYMSVQLHVWHRKRGKSYSERIKCWQVFRGGIVQHLLLFRTLNYLLVVGTKIKTDLGEISW